MEALWVGHSAFRLHYANAVILLDPFITGNPLAPNHISVASLSEGCTHVAISHGHDDHIGDVIEICKRTGAQVIANYELCLWLQEQGIETINPGNTGGTIDCGSFRTTFTLANHSSGITRDGASIYLGNPNGFVLEAEDEPSVYFMGDTNMFGDMAFIEEFHHPQVGILPIGDRFTMGGRQAAVACKRFFDFQTIIPCHYGTFDIIDQTPDLFLSEMGSDAYRVKVLEVGVLTDI